MSCANVVRCQKQRGTPTQLSQCLATSTHHLVCREHACLGFLLSIAAAACPSAQVGTALLQRSAWWGLSGGPGIVALNLLQHLALDASAAPGSDPVGGRCVLCCPVAAWHPKTTLFIGW